MVPRGWDTPACLCWVVFFSSCFLVVVDTFCGSCMLVMFVSLFITKGIPLSWDGAARLSRRLFIPGFDFSPWRTRLLSVEVWRPPAVRPQTFVWVGFCRIFYRYDYVVKHIFSETGMFYYLFFVWKFILSPAIFASGNLFLGTMFPSSFFGDQEGNMVFFVLTFRPGR